MVMRTGFEPVNDCVKGSWVDRFSNAPVFMAVPVGLEPTTDRLTADSSTYWATGPTNIYKLIRYKIKHFIPYFFGIPYKIRTRIFRSVAWYSIHWTKEIYGWDTWIRTSMELPPRDFKSLASTCSATNPYGWGGWIRTSALTSQSRLCFRFTTPQIVLIAI